MWTDQDNKRQIGSGSVSGQANLMAAQNKSVETQNRS